MIKKKISDAQYVLNCIPTLQRVAVNLFAHLDGNEVDVALVCHGPSKERLAGSGRTVQQHPAPPLAEARPALQWQLNGGNNVRLGAPHPPNVRPPHRRIHAILAVTELKKRLNLFILLVESDRL